MSGFLGINVKSTHNRIFLQIYFFCQISSFLIISAAFEGSPILDIPTVALLRIHFFAFFGVKVRGDRQGNLSRKLW